MMRTADFDYSLPEELIAQTPGPRGESRLLSLDSRGRIAHRRVGDLPSLLRSGDLLVVNDTRVIPARLLARRPETGGRLELLLVEPVAECRWKVLVKPARRAAPGRRFQLAESLDFVVVERQEAGTFVIEFSEPVEPHLDHLGHVPLPPYIRRADRPADRVAYQTVYARQPGAIAAPTAGLHFTEELLARLREAGIATASITLHVGPGTFRPVTAAEIDDHRMDVERFEIPGETAEAVARAQVDGGRIVAVGTTVVRSLESAMRQLGAIEPMRGKTDLFIRPGHQFAAVDLLLTNFHLPRSTLLMLVCAFAGRHRVLLAYHQAIAEGYRFYSYGDCMLVESDKPRRTDRT